MYKQEYKQASRRGLLIPCVLLTPSTIKTERVWVMGAIIEARSANYLLASNVERVEGTVKRKGGCPGRC